MQREIQFVGAVDVPYDAVRRSLRRPDTAAGIQGDPPRIVLTTRSGHTWVSHEVDVVVDGFDGDDTECRLTLSGDTAEHPELGAHFTMTVDAMPVDAHRTAIFLRVRYQPPLGWMGGLFDTLGPRRAFTRALDRWFTGLLGHLGDASATLAVREPAGHRRVRSVARHRG